MPLETPTSPSATPSRPRRVTVRLLGAAVPGTILHAGVEPDVSAVEALADLLERRRRRLVRAGGDAGARAGGALGAVLGAVVEAELGEHALDVADVLGALVARGAGALLDEGPDRLDDGRVAFLVGQPPVLDLRQVPELGDLGAEGGGVDVAVPRLAYVRSNTNEEGGGGSGGVGTSTVKFVG